MKMKDGKKGCTYLVEDIQLEEAIMRRLQMLGMIQGTRVDILNKKHSALIFKVRGTRYAIGTAVAAGIEVKEVSDHD